MKAVHKKAGIVGVKLAVLVGLLLYAFQQLQLDDELLVPAAGTSAAARLPESHIDSRGRAHFTLRTSDGRATTVEEGARLRVLDQSPPIQSPAIQSPPIQARTPAGTIVRIDPSNTVGPTPVFERLPGVLSTWRTLRLPWFLAAIAIFGPAIFLMVPRWYILLRASEVTIPFWTAARLVYMSHFFNTFMPGGAVGGDAIRAVVVTSHSHRKAEAATMVLIDRVIGLLGLLAMAGVVVLWKLRGLGSAVLPIGVVSVAVLVSAMLFYSATARRLLHYDSLLSKLPRADVLRKIDGALYALKGHPRALASAFVVTLSLQLLEVLGIWCAGQSLGVDKASFSHYLVFVPIGYLANAIPLSFGGIGLMEGAYLKLFADASIATPAQAFMLGVLARLAASAWAIPGVLSALFPPTASHTAQGQPTEELTS